MQNVPKKTGMQDASSSVGVPGTTNGVVRNCPVAPLGACCLRRGNLFAQTRKLPTPKGRLHGRPETPKPVRLVGEMSETFRCGWRLACSGRPRWCGRRNQ